MKSPRSVLALASTVVAVVLTPALAQDKSGPNLGTTAASAAPGGVATLSLAQDLYAVGVAQGDAVTVLAAAKLAISLAATAAEPAALDATRIVFADGDQSRPHMTLAPTGSAEPVPMMRDNGPRRAKRATFFTATSEAEGPSDAPVTADAMFAMARKLAGDDEAILSLIDDATTEATRDRVGGVIEWPSHLPPGQTDVWEIPFHGNSRAEVAVVGDGDANLDVAVTDANGNVICKDVSWSDKLACNWTPAWDGYFYVTVQNLGGVRNSYSLLTN